MKEQIMLLYDQIRSDAETRLMDSVCKALPFLYKQVSSKIQSARSTAAVNRYEAELLHCLQVAEMLINLHLPITHEEEDVLLSAVILHIYPEIFSMDQFHEDVKGSLGLSQGIVSLIDVIHQEKDLSDEEQRDYYNRVQENKLALLAVLADRGNIMQHLYRYSTWNAHRYIEETKACFYPMCIYGKEHYHELLGPISVLTEKLRTLLEVSEVLLWRYEVRESELTEDILALREENAVIRGIIKKFQMDE